MNLTLFGLCDRDRLRIQLLPPSKEPDDDENDVKLGGSSSILSDSLDVLVVVEGELYLGGSYLLVDVDIGTAGAETEAGCRGETNP